MFFVRNLFYIAVLFYGLTWITSVIYFRKQSSRDMADADVVSIGYPESEKKSLKKNTPCSIIYLFFTGLAANFISMAGRYYFSFPLMPMYETPFFLPFFIGIFSIITINSENKTRLPGIAAIIFFLSLTALLFPNDFYLPFLKSKTIFSHIFFLSGVMAKACFIIAGIYSIYDLLSVKTEKNNYNYGKHNQNKTIVKNNTKNNGSTTFRNFIVIGFALWTISMFSGEIWSFTGWGCPIVWDDPAILTTMATWLYYVCFLHLHLLTEFDLRKRQYAAVVGMILLLVLNFYPDLGIFRMPVFT